METYFICHPSYECSCFPGKLISRRTALRHKKKATERLLSLGNVVQLPNPSIHRTSDPPIENAGDVDPELTVSGTVTAEVVADSQDDTLEGSVEEHGNAADEGQYAHNQPTRNPTADTSPGIISHDDDEQMSPTHGQSAANDEVTSDMSLSVTNEEGDGVVEEGLQLDDELDEGLVVFRKFMETRGWVVGFSIKHHLSRSASDDLLGLDIADVPRSPYLSFKTVREKLLKYSELKVSRHPFCAHSHESLTYEVGNDNCLTPCSFRKCEWHDDCTSEEAVRFYEYTSVWSQLKPLICSEDKGKQLFEYYQESVKMVFSEAYDGEIFDFMCGENFKRTAQRLGGFEQVLDDIILYITTDGIQPYRNSKTRYTYWPVIAIVANLPPSERYKTENIIPLMMIPGPKQPKDLTSFLAPLIEELQDLGENGKLVRMANGTVKRCRVWAHHVMGDLPAVAKLSHLLGHRSKVPCRFCVSEGHHSASSNSVYFPAEYNGVVLCDPDNIELRDPRKIRRQYRKLSNMELKGKTTKANTRAKQYGFSSITPTPFLSLSSVYPFTSFPIDIMHLFYANISKLLLGIWAGDDERLGALSVLTDKAIVTGVDDNLLGASGSFPTAHGRRPRSIEYRNTWKSSEWKVYVVNFSLFALYGWIPQHILDGWADFVMIVKICEQWRISDSMMEELEKISKRFYRHIMEVYYAGVDDRLSVCRFVVHLMLHLGDSIRASGPLSMTAQWSMENYAGKISRECQATDRFAESVSESRKAATAAKIFSLYSNAPLKFLPDFEEKEEDQTIRNELRHGIDGEIYEGIFFRNPRKQVSLRYVSQLFSKDIFSMLKRCFQTIGVSAEAMEQLENELEVVMWSRLEVEKCRDDSSFVFSCFKGGENRSTSFFAASFEAGGVNDPHRVSYSYGRLEGVLEITLEGTSYMLILARWISRSLFAGVNGQIYAKSSAESNNLFSTFTIETADCVSHPIQAYDMVSKSGDGKPLKRVYFYDPLAERFGFTTGKPWYPEDNNAVLDGLKRSPSTNARRNRGVKRGRVEE